MKVPIPAECGEPSRYQRIVCKEKRCKITFINRAGLEVVKYAIDICPRLRPLLENPRSKLCDFLVVVQSRGEQHYVELKGKNIEHALAQIESTVQELRLLNPAKSVRCWIIATESPRASSKFQTLQLKFEQRLKARLKIYSLEWEHVLS
jgi:hypothetical protein